MKKYYKIYTDFLVHVPKEYKMKEEAKEFPLMIVLSVSYVCNAKCPACPYTISTIREKYKNAQFVSEKLFKKIADECGKYGAFIRLTGGGEPMLHPNIVELIEYAKSVGAKIGLITNGSMFNEENTKRLLKANVDMVEFSVDAAKKEDYEKIRIGLNWEKLVENIERMVSLRNEMNSTTKIIVSAIVQQGINPDEILDFWKKRVDHVQLRKYLTWGMGDPSKSADPTPYLPSTAPCPWPFERMNVDTFGNVALCGYDIAFKTNFGNVMEKSIKEIWHSEAFEKVRQLHLSGRMDMIPLCRTCTDRKYRTWNYNYYKLVEIAEKNRKNNLKSEG
ncbi:radical SAM protein [Thermosipho melanesiensis]|uniref:Radical SAM domain protein n=2 Tax=Thermosipho melanesiensis TaxID=46541 RepID=A6LKC3_THEM4|nr:radical SAM protein [Thermosipho melanesiensis]ABR30374.1 Radical SAM domain protein [Thermosipho melanesiensis BI429]APT73538.1 radical SAM protein [Thermosipho melanesiensis]OOC37489.1 radical SAM protein [Thermosipho melanesiensis]OOC39628.1 radical SAM protein [Thermosipho melanesiensis]OOC39646.1 radical SAM protein [Thermosipho melanesiensis]